MPERIILGESADRRHRSCLFCLLLRSASSCSAGGGDDQRLHLQRCAAKRQHRGSPRRHPCGLQREHCSCLLPAAVGAAPACGCLLTVRQLLWSPFAIFGGAVRRSSRRARPLVVVDKPMLRCCCFSHLFRASRAFCRVCVRRWQLPGDHGRGAAAGEGAAAAAAAGQLGGLQRPEPPAAGSAAGGAAAAAALRRTQLLLRAASGRISGGCCAGGGCGGRCCSGSAHAGQRQADGRGGAGREDEGPDNRAHR